MADVRALARRAATREASRGSCLAAVAGSGGRALASNRLAMSGATKASGGGQALSGDVAGRGQAKDESAVPNSSRIAPDFGGVAEAVTRAANARDFERDGRERRGLCGESARGSSATAI